MVTHDDQKAPEPDFGSLLSLEIQGLYRYAYSLIGRPAEAEDVVGETLLRALERQTQFHNQTPLRSWLHQILRNIAIDRSRHQSHESLVEEVESTWSDERYRVDAEMILERLELRGELQEALFHLPVKYREVVVLHDAEGWSTPEIATMLEVALPAIKQRLRRGRMMLVTSLAKGAERKVANRNVVMRCADARYQVSDYIDGDLPAEQASLLEAHLASCATCPSLYTSLVGVTASLGSLRDPNTVVPSDLAQRITMKLATKARAPGKPAAPS
ncbi:MAG: sigma-70 family RNA polymerase sigma factor [Ferrimicrobium sp.]|uniref:sigma-70 family RNA polymerase sigma factor n=1 Tax=Ferrimicrobium sp. TaxID=2926050 RepID=UPI002611F14A|nr:sigma-70 family RNA polymerase sigma factor [Ferrimicrobium sp.]